MKRIISLILVVAFAALCLTGCGEKDRILYKSVKLTKYVDLAEYKGIKIDASSDEFKKLYDEIIAGDVEDYDLYVRKTEGTVANGDTANIDYVGKKDGVAFEGGTASGYDLTIGSNSFIDGFETGLIGVEIGSTVDLNLTFPTNYQSSDLAGKAVVFTVKVNYVKTTDPMSPEDYYKQINFKTLKEYEADVKDRAIKGNLLETVIDKSKVKDYPEEDIEILKNDLIKLFEKNLQYYGMTIDTYISQTGMTQEAFDKKFLDEQVYPLMNEQMVLYAILDKEKEEVTTEDVDNRIKEMIKEIGESEVTADQLKEYYGEYYFENMVVSEKVSKIIKGYAKIK
ncbi:MAG: FKBP-type peptidyl-prolyl cis-trans isomerase [Clostridia bacterium]|nr:FKBP-type peptidyl-prolyl cis-trans isomerase [Clostridia bacterium]